VLERARADKQLPIDTKLHTLKAEAVLDTHRIDKTEPSRTRASTECSVNRAQPRMLKEEPTSRHSETECPILPTADPRLEALIPRTESEELNLVKYSTDSVPSNRVRARVEKLDASCA
jgi:hypothetical protein